MKNHPSNMVRAMALVDYSLADMRPAYPGKDEIYLDQLLRDSSLALNRPLLSYGILGIYPCETRCFNVTKYGFRSNGRQQPWPPDPEKTNVFFFSGSAGLGLYLEDSQTISAKLQGWLEAKNVKCEVYNFASGSYTSRRSGLRFLDLVDQGLVPDYAVFLDGINDCYFALGGLELAHTLDSLYQTEKRRRKLSYLSSVIDFARSSYAGRQKALPTQLNYEEREEDEEFRHLLSDSSVEAALASSNRQLSLGELTDAQIKVAKMVWNRYLDSVAMIRGAATRRRVKTFFVWQPVSLYKTSKGQRLMERLSLIYRHNVFSWIVYNWLHACQFPGVSDDPEFVDLSRLGEAAEGALYIDTSYTAYFAEEIARVLAGKLTQADRMDRRRMAREEDHSMGRRGYG